MGGSRGGHRSEHGRLAKSFIEPSDLLVFHVVEEMRVSIHDTRVSQQGLHYLRALALVEEFGREGVPQAVEGETLVSETSFL